MQQQTSLHIATPCHEDWNAMTPAGKGKFCASCSKQVVDFTLMSDSQILHFLSQQQSSLCGRFNAGQLARPLVQPTLSKKRSWYFALALPLSLFFQKSFAQTKGKTVGKPAVHVQQKQTPKPVHIVMGAPAMIAPGWVTLHGTVKDEKGNAVSYASVMEKGTQNGCMSDSAGRFLLKLRPEVNSVILVADAIGYQSINQEVSVKEAKTEIWLKVTTEEFTNDSVLVTATHRTTGLVSVCKRVTRVEKTGSLLKKTLQLHTFTLYPNPARSGSPVQVTIKQKGDYQLQLLTNSSALLKTMEMPVQSDNTTSPFQLPANLAAGIYYMRLLNINTKVSYVEKLMVY